MKFENYSKVAKTSVDNVFKPDLLHVLVCMSAL